MAGQIMLQSLRVANRSPIKTCVRAYAAPVHKFEKYEPKVVESDWYAWWQKRGLFAPKRTDNMFTMLLPPPNVTGVLHIGHALTLSIQDAIARWNRMHGRSVNWVPGTDHAGISMQSVVEKKLKRETGQTRHDLGREAFVDEVWKWKQQHGDRIKQQTTRIGASLNWAEEYFTMDPQHSQVVRDAFIRLYDDGLVYRTTKMVNWSCALQSVISDIEITPAHDENDYACAQRLGLPAVQVFGPDGAVVQDAAVVGFAGISRWQARQKVITLLTDSGAYMGKRDAEQSVISRCSRSGDVIEPMLMPQWYVRCSELAQRANNLVQEKAIELIPDRQRAVWNSWMSGIDDWCVSRQLWWGHRIPVYRVSWDGGEIGDMWVAAESEQQAQLKAVGKLGSEDKALAANLQCTIIQDEDVLDTWFSSGLLPLTAFNQPSVLAPARDMNATNQPSLSSVLETGQDILFFWVARMAMLCTYFAKVPPFSTVLLHPMVRDAQGRKMSKSLGNIIDPMDIINGAELSQLQKTLQNGHMTEQELDKGMRELKKLYPNGFQSFGADALRFTLLVYTQQTQQINMSLDTIRASYHFCNKLWNTFRFIHMHAANLGLDAGQACIADIDQNQMSVFDRALLSRLHAMLETYHQAMSTYRLAVAAETVREFVQRDLCDRYIEACKPALYGNCNVTNQDPHVAVKVLLGALDIVLRSLHPFMPFLSEELWQQHARKDASDELSIMEREWSSAESKAIAHDSRSEEENDASILVFGAVSGIRSLKQQHPTRLQAGTGSAARLTIVVTVPERAADAGGRGAGVDRATAERVREIATKHEACIALMSKELAIRICTASDSDSSAADSGTAVVVVTPYMRIVGQLVDNDGQQPQSAKSVAAVAKLETELAKVRKVVGSGGYRRSAPEAVKEADR
ncbi:hypothetical protein LPJ62_001581 [Coemansia sp. RSA 2167]|nr:hypothetical protein LPJ62_001581 [Coemansia sp. RSA 2167]